MSDKKQTAVQWLVNEYAKAFKIQVNAVMLKSIEQALQMEREQIVESFMEGTKMDNINDELSARFNGCIYYGEKFGENYGGQDEN
jgi:hypothetical protein